MYIEQLYTGCLSEAAYYIESNGEVAVIDPIRETAPYLKLAESRGAKIKYIFETHFHADFVSGHIDLAKQTGATIVYGPNANPQYDVHIAQDGETFSLGALQLKALHTPGHTPESTCYLLKDNDGQDHAIFTGDTLFVGAVGRPDLAVKSDPPLEPKDLANMLFDSLHKHIMPLADEVLVYPAHGAGSSCGKGIGKETFSTIGVQKQTNYALQPMSREEFIQEVTEGLLPPPAYFFEDARINMQGYAPLNEVMASVRPLSPSELEDTGGIVLDTRHPNDFEKGHVPGAINIGLNGQFAIWVGTLIDINSKLLLVTETGKEEESVRRLARVGYDNVTGYLEGGMESWNSNGRESATVESLTAEEFAEVSKEDLVVLDVRKPGEFQGGHLEEALHISLAELPKVVSQLNSDQTYLIHCAGGYRSMIAASLMKRANVHKLKNIYGGFGAIVKAGVPMVEPVI